MGSDALISRPAVRLARAAVLLLVLLALVMIVSLQFGASGATVADAFRGSEVSERILLRLRLPRIALAALVGFVLGITGSTFQTLLRNSLADPFVLGVSGGAAAGATLIASIGLAFVPGAVAGASFGGALFAIYAVLRLSRSAAGFDTARLVLAGLVMNAFFSAIITLALSFTYGSDLQSALRWMMGGFFRATWSDVAVVAVAGSVTLALLLYHASSLRLMAFGSDHARAQGVDTRRLERFVFVLTSLATAAAVSVSGVIGFVGLMVPHGVRLIWPGDFRTNLPLSGLAGALLLVIADVLARMLVVPSELPVGALTACVGVPFFLFLLRRVM